MLNGKALNYIPISWSHVNKQKISNFSKFSPYIWRYFGQAKIRYIFISHSTKDVKRVVKKINIGRCFHGEKRF